MSSAGRDSAKDSLRVLSGTGHSTLTRRGQWLLEGAVLGTARTLQPPLLHATQERQ